MSDWFDDMAFLDYLTDGDMGIGIFERDKPYCGTSATDDDDDDDNRSSGSDTVSHEYVAPTMSASQKREYDRLNAMTPSERKKYYAQFDKYRAEYKAKCEASAKERAEREKKWYEEQHRQFEAEQAELRRQNPIYYWFSDHFDHACDNAWKNFNTVFDLADKLSAKVNKALPKAAKTPQTAASTGAAEAVSQTVDNLASWFSGKK